MTPNYERISTRLLRPIPVRRIARFIDGRLLTGHATQHRHHIARRWRTFWRIKKVRP